MDEVRPDGDWAVFTRSGWLYEHSVAQIVWIGHQEANWSEEDGLPTVMPALLNLGYARDAARKAVERAWDGEGAEPTLETVLRSALSHLVR